MCAARLPLCVLTCSPSLFAPTPSLLRMKHHIRLWRYACAPRRCSIASKGRASLSTSSDFERIDPSYLVEEETLSRYKPRDYYPVKLGEVLHDRYQTIGKLGYGSASTVWLCRDLQEPQAYVAIKVFINNSRYHRELPIYEEINELRTTHEGQQYIRKMYDSFELSGPHGTHICLVHQPLGISLDELKTLNPGGLFSSELLRQTMRCILTGLQFLHKEVQIIHTGTPALRSQLADWRLLLISNPSRSSAFKHAPGHPR